MRIITIDREFGSGGRELGKRLADALRIPCYDQEIIEEVAKLHGLESGHVEHISEADVHAVYPMTIGRRFQFYPVHTKDSIQVLIGTIFVEEIRLFIYRLNKIPLSESAGNKIDVSNPAYYNNDMRKRINTNI